MKIELLEMAGLGSALKALRLPVWHTFCEWVESLPFANELITNGL